MKAIVIVGGQATRLRPLTDRIPKAMVDVQGRPMVEHILLLLKKYGITDIILSVGYLKEHIIDYFNDGSALGLAISYLKEDEPLGTAGPLNLLEEKITETFIACNGDILFNINIADVLEFHRQNQATATIALTPVADPSSFGVASMQGPKIIEFVEKPKREDAPSNLINAGLYVLEPEVLTMIPPGKAMFEYDVFPQLAHAGKLFGFKSDGQWFDAGNFERLETTRKEWKGI